ncbi:hypothetical protein SAMN05421810_108146 [Amycolatopsis arida]|uniref:Uncharacterized protein n=1 Tax=Amycolatopsis arida TaxID=587909 RepID=A0A1I5Z2A7_9PSEU|nr:hypothetical protein [Amycolatopsis arida]TDX90059.1 hypothetical protein CLV69_108146 [Amycolatopsis arida]SFQ50552.1 hypothetical protein SAMN05421810_108146 [Amycolatopsis arida]
MAHHGYEYEEIDETAPRRLRAHTPAVEDSFGWLDTPDTEADEQAE